MTKAKTFRFAVQSYFAETPDQWRARARRAEELGFSTFHLADHFLGPGDALSGANHPVQNLAAVPAMVVAAEATSSLRVGCRVFCVDYREPAVLAKEAATLDFFSGGRLELGLGAGWLRGEYESAGIEFTAFSKRMERLEETIALLRGHFSSGEIDVRGKHVQVGGYEGLPKPVQQPGPPIMIGGGSRRILSLAGREADIVSINFNNRSGKLGGEGVSSGSAAETDKKIGWIREAAGDRFDDLELEIGAYFTVVTEQVTETLAGMASSFQLPEEEIAVNPHALVGPPQAIVDRLQERRERFGISYITIPDRAMEDFAPVVKELAGR